MSKQRRKGRFLTDTQVDYLHGNHEPPNKDAEYTMRSKIRSRTLGAFDHLKILHKCLSEDDLKLLFENWESEDEKVAKARGENRIVLPKQLGAISMIIAMSYRGYRLNGMEPERFVSLVVEGAIRKGEADFKGVDPNTETTVDLALENIDTYPRSGEMDPVEKYHKGLALTRDEYVTVAKRLENELGRDFDIEDMSDLVDEHLVESDE